MPHAYIPVSKMSGIRMCYFINVLGGWLDKFYNTSGTKWFIFFIPGALLR